MTLTILDPRSVKNIPVVRQPVAAKVVTHPRFARPN